MSEVEEPVVAATPVTATADVPPETQTEAATVVRTRPKEVTTEEEKLMATATAMTKKDRTALSTSLPHDHGHATRMR